MIGKRVQPDENGWFSDKMNPGEYVKVDPQRMADGSPIEAWVKRHYPYWLVCTPNNHCGSLANHAIEEHGDGTITVSPSILISVGERGTKSYRELWHGWLKAGVWSDA